MFSPFAFQQPQLVTNGLVLYLDASDRTSYVSGSTTWNSLSGGLTGSLTNGPIFNSGNAGSIVFDGVDDYVVTAPISFNSSIVTVNTWFYWTNYSNSDNLLLELSPNGNVNPNTFIIDPNSSAPTNGVFQFTIFGNGSGNYYGSYINRLPQSTWQYLSVIFDNSTTTGNIICYVNGVLQTLINNRNTKNTSGNFKVDNLYLMSRAGSSLIAKGNIASTQIYNRALSAQEVLQNFNAQRQRFNI